MTIEALVAELAAAPCRSRSAARERAALVAIIALEVLLILLSGAMRPDMAAALTTSIFWWKLVSLATLASIGLGIAVASNAPDRAPAGDLRWLALALAAVLVAGFWLSPARPIGDDFLDRMAWPSGLRCASAVTLLSLPLVAASVLLARRGAPIDRAGTALAAGAGSAAGGAFVFAFACPAGDPLYIIVWYSIGCGAVTALSRLALPRLTRW